MMFAALLLPDFALQCALRAEHDVLSASRLAALVDDEEDVVTAVTLVALRAGVGPGMRTAQALARCAGLRFVSRSPVQERIATEALLQAAARVTPYYEDTAPGLATLDLSRRPDPAPSVWAADILSSLAALALSARIGAAGDPESALRLACLATAVEPVREAENFAAAVSPLSLAALDVPTELQPVLADWGLRTVGELLALNREEIGLRLGPAGLALWDRAAGRTTRPLRFARVPEIYRELTEFEGGIETLEPLLFRLRRLLEELAARVGSAYLLIKALDLRLEVDHGGVPIERRLTLAAPTGDVDLLFRVAHGWLDTVQTEAPVLSCEVIAQPSPPEDLQPGLFESALRDPNAFAETLSRLVVLAGEGRVGTPRRANTHRPNRFTLELPRFFEEDRTGYRAEPPRRLTVGLALRRFRPPLPVEVEAWRGRPQNIRGPREWSGGVRTLRGPWRMSGDWWEAAQEWAWDEWDVELVEGPLLRVATWQKKWWVLGNYD